MGISEDFFDNNSPNGKFIRAVGCTENYGEFIERLDRTGDKSGNYRRVNEFPPLRDNEDIARAAAKYEAVMSGNFSGGDKNFADSLKKILDISRNSGGNYNKTIEKNHAVSFIFWFDTLLPKGAGRGRFICSGNIRQKEYLFCCLAFYCGFDVMILLPEGDISLSPSMLDISRKVIPGECRRESIPAYLPRSASGSIAKNGAAVSRTSQPGQGQTSRDYHVVLDHPKRCPLGSSVNISRPARNNNNGAVTAGRISSESIPPRAVSSGNVPPRGVTAGNIAVHTPSVTPGVTAVRELTFEELAQLAESVVMIETEDRSGEVTGCGSGVVIDSKGYILTNCHVASHGNMYRVRMENDNNIYRTDRLLKYHPVNDLAVIRIDRPMKPLKIYGGGKELVRGQKVVAIGSPHGLFNSVSDGIIAGLRVIDDVDMIQFTAPISGGSSGGALLNRRWGYRELSIHYTFALSSR
ncbi:MAG: trypsin-like peptidase domain-containing protein, partial [Ruminococcus sp.]|nr:trypsin-like peptidase domain-containing protein [Ruminococcus sp.]